MAGTHTLRIDYDEATGAVTATHGCTVTVAGLAVRHSRAVELGPDAAAALKTVLDANRELVEREAGALAVSHAAAVAGKKQPGVIPLRINGTLGALGGADAKKAD